MVSDYKPLGDQPRAIEELVDGALRGLSHQTLLGITGSGKTATMSWVIEKLNRPALIMAPNKTLAAQLYGEFKKLFPQQRRRVLRLVLRLLPARSVPADDRHLHREGLVDQRRDRQAAPLRDALGALAPRRDRGRERLVHLRPRLARDLRRDARLRRGRAAAQPRRLHAQARRHAHTTATTSTSTAAPSACAATWSRCSRPTRTSARSGSSSSATTWTRSPRSIRCAGWSCSRLKRAVVFPNSHYVQTQERLKQAIAGIREELDVRLQAFKRDEQAARGAAHRAAHDVRPRDARPRWASATASRTTRAGSTGASDEPAAVHADRLLPEGLPVLRRREPRHRAADRRHVPRRPAAQGDAGRVRLPAAVARSTTARCASRSGSSACGQVVFVSATPAEYELEKSGGIIVEQIIRPTGLIDPAVEMRPAQEPGRGPARRDPQARRARRPRARHDADQAHGRGAHDLLPGGRDPRALPALRDRRRSSARRSCATCATASSTCWSASTCCARG